MNTTTNANRILSAYIRTFETEDKATGAKSERITDKVLCKADFSEKEHYTAYKRLILALADPLLSVQNADPADRNKAADKAVKHLQDVFDFLNKYEGVKAVKATRTDIVNIAAETAGRIRVSKADKAYSKTQSGPAAIQKQVERAAYLHINSMPWPNSVKSNATLTAQAKQSEQDKRKADIEQAKKDAAKQADEKAKKAARKARKAEKAASAAESTAVPAPAPAPAAESTAA